MSRPEPVSVIEPGLVVLHSNRMEVLRDSLVYWLRTRPLDPLETDIIAVQSNGIGQWLRSRLAAPDDSGAPGIAAALDTPMPSRLVWRLYRSVLGHAAVPEFSPLDEQPLVWRLMRVLRELPEGAPYGALRQFLDDDPDLRKRYQLAQRLADLYDQYQVYRADWLADWAAGEDQLRGPGAVRPLEASQSWQAALWRDILADLEPEARNSGRAAVHARFLQHLKQWPLGADRPDLPRRIVVFGVSSLPRQILEAFVAASRWTQVLVCVHNPCEFHWADIVEGRTLLRNVKRHQQPRPGMPPDFDADHLHEHAHPLLASWGRQGRDYIALLEELDDEIAHDAEAPVAVAPAFQQVEGASALAQLQDDIRALRPLVEVRSEERRIAPDDRSFSFHVAHSALREVEILHDQLLAAFDADHSLQPDDVIVMVPDIEQYAPHIDAVFGLHGAEDLRRLPYFIVDRGPAAVNTVIDAVEHLLALPTARMGLGDVLDLLDIAAVRERFELTEDDLSVLREWLQSANVRWGLDTAHRKALGLDIAPELADVHTWEFGLRRMLLGYATGDAGDWHGIAPHADVAGLEARLVGTLALIFERLQHYARLFGEPAEPQEWEVRLRNLLADFLKAPDDAAAYRLEQLSQALAAWLEECEAGRFDEPLTLAVVSRHWLSALKSPGMAQRFTSGAVTFATLMPMRAIPFRHVYLLGMNDGDYPRPRTPAHFDLMERDYRPGDRSRRDDDRYLFLEALLSARDRFYISWVGRSIVDNTERAPSVLVGQLRDHLAAGWRAADGSDGVLAQLTTVHPLQAFSLEYFRDAAPGASHFTYAREWRAAAPAADNGKEAVHATEAPLLDPPERDEPLSVRELAEFLEHPVREFFRQRLQVRYEESESVVEEEAFVADGLDTWKVNNELISTARRPLESGDAPQAACEAVLDRMRRSGELAFGGAGHLQAERCRKLLYPMFAQYRKVLDEWPLVMPEQIELRHDCAGTPGLVGWLDGLRRRSNSDHTMLRLHMQATHLTEKSQHWRDEKLLEHWVQHLAANRMGLALHTMVMSPAGTATFLPVDPAQASGWLDTLLRAWVEGMRRPLPIKGEFARPLLSLLPAEADPYAGSEFWQDLLTSEKLAAALRKCHADLWNRAGYRDAAYEVRAYPTLESLLAGGELLRWAQRLYRPLFIALREEGGLP